VQIGVDGNDINAAKNFKGSVETVGAAVRDEVSESRLAPYSEVFGLQRFRECELIHGRWAMLATLGCLVAESSTGVSWVDAGKVELDGATYLGLPLPFSIGQLCWIEALLMGGAEVYRNTQLDPELRLYPGGAFDPLNLASGDDAERTFKLRTAEIKHGRLAMVAFLGFGVQALATGEGVVGSLAKFTEGFSKSA
jgi:light-harvesting complex II chlorophyll a/b binding protein 4